MKCAADCTVKCTAVVLGQCCDLRRALWVVRSKCLRTFVLSDRDVLSRMSVVDSLSPVFTQLIRIFQIGPGRTLYVVVIVVVGLVVVVVVVVAIVEAVLLVVKAMVQRIETPSFACHDYHHSSCSASKNLGMLQREEVREYKSQRNGILHKRSTIHYGSREP